MASIATTLGEALPIAQETSTSLRVRSRYRSHAIFKYGARLRTCQRHPRICLAKGSPGRNCCKNRCVEVRSDRYNCGRCGKRCRYSEICCNGKCVNPMFHRNHCGGCFNGCSRGSSCFYGMCGYA
ncbi:PREDICTED: stigma-specific STIG1-like protein 1 [Tarenaya hassleriana]|uniref:stigma-specific STIG1-like protein 1 n=1 Tax=Tarenaya hassleriana TaxID=28532 RepID=UPI00053C1E33|nr:PREDICTED: stigma-specific STIG1-like protein 1 [Tarenaya hassleriana]